MESESIFLLMVESKSNFSFLVESELESIWSFLVESEPESIISKHPESEPRSRSRSRSLFYTSESAALVSMVIVR